MAKAPKLYIRGIAKYPKTDKTYTWSESLNKSVPDEDGKFELELIVTPARAAGYEKSIREWAAEEGMKRPKKVPFKAEVDKETEEPTGNIIFKSWQYGKDFSGKSRKVAHFDAKGKPLPADFLLTFGSEVIMAVKPGIYKPQGGGVNLRLEGVQVVKYRERNEDPGFAALEEEGAYEADEDETNASTGFADVSETEDGDSTDF